MGGSLLVPLSGIFQISKLFPAWVISFNDCGVDVELIAHTDGPFDHADGWRIAAGGAVINEHVPPPLKAATFRGHQQEIVDRIDANARYVPAAVNVAGSRHDVLLSSVFCFPSDNCVCGPPENTFGSHVAVVQPIEHENRLIRRGQVDFIVYRVNADLAGGADAFDLRFVSLDHS